MISLEPSKIEIDAAIAQETFDRDRLLAATGERLRSFVTATAADLHRVIGDLPGRFRRPHFAHRGFDAQIARLAIDQSRGEKRHRFHGEDVAGHLRDFSGDGGMFADRHAPLNSFARPLAADFEQAFRQTDARGGNCQPAGVQRRQRDFQSLAFLRDHVFARHADVREFHDAVVKRAQSHETAAIRDLESGRIDIDNERGDLFALLAVDDLRRCPRHDHEHAGLDQVRAPKFFAVENERGAVFGRVGAQTHVRRIGAGIPFRQREGGNFVARDARQIFFLLFLRAKQQQRLRQRRSIDARKRARSDLRPSFRATSPRDRN